MRGGRTGVGTALAGRSDVAVGAVVAEQSRGGGGYDKSVTGTVTGNCISHPKEAYLTLATIDQELSADGLLFAGPIACSRAGHNGIRRELDG